MLAYKSQELQNAILQVCFLLACITSTTYKTYRYIRNEVVHKDELLNGYLVKNVIKSQTFEIAHIWYDIWLIVFNVRIAQ